MTRPARHRALLLAPALTLAATALAGCGSDDVERTYAGVASSPCEALTTADLVITAYADLEAGEPRETDESGDGEDVGTCTLEARPAAGSTAPTGAAPGQVTVAVTVRVLADGDPATDFDRLADYADDLVDPATSDDVREEDGELDGGWWADSAWWRTSWTEAGPAPQQLVEAASVSRDNALVQVVVTERDLAVDDLAAAEDRVHDLVQEQLEAAKAALED